MTKPASYSAALAVFVLAFCCVPYVECAEITLYVSAPKAASADVPVHATIEMPREFAGVPANQIKVSLKQVGAAKTVPPSPGQIVIGENKEAQVWFVLPQARAFSTGMWIATLERRQGAEEPGFVWKDEPGKHLDLFLGSRKVTSYMYAFDKSTEQSDYETIKPFFHVFDARGRLLTNGPDGVHPFLKGRTMSYHIHRGILTGWHLAYKGKEYNFWGMEDGVRMVHQKFLEQVSGPVLAKSGSLVAWNDKDGRPIVNEQRYITTYRTSDPAIMLADFRVVLEPVEGEVLLIADREHGGLQYRAHNDVALAPAGSDAKAKFLLPAEGIDPNTDLDIPWAVMSYGLDGRRYTVQLMNSGENPKPTAFSAYRDYGRMGACTQVKVRAGQPLTLHYRIWVTEGGPADRAEYAGRYEAFANPPAVRVYSYSTEKVGRMPWSEK